MASAAHSCHPTSSVSALFAARPKTRTFGARHFGLSQTRLDRRLRRGATCPDSEERSPGVPIAADLRAPLAAAHTVHLFDADGLSAAAWSVASCIEYLSWQGPACLVQLFQMRWAEEFDRPSFRFVGNYLLNFVW